MSSREHLESWKRTEQFLRDARASFASKAENACRAALSEYDEYLQHNELELALEALAEAFDEARCWNPAAAKSICGCGTEYGSDCTCRSTRAAVFWWRWRLTIRSSGRQRVGCGKLSGVAAAAA